MNLGSFHIPTIIATVLLVFGLLFAWGLVKKAL